MSGTPVDVVEKAYSSSYATPRGFGGLGLKTTGDRFAGFGPQKPREDLGAAHGVIVELVSRQSDFREEILAV